MAKKKYLCKECEAVFDSPQALGGHMLQHHRSGSQVPVQEPATTGATGKPKQDELPTVAAVEKPSEAEQVRQYLDQGISFHDLTKRMGFSETTVRREEAKRIKQGKGMDSDKASAYPVIIKEKEIITPEGILNKLADGSVDWNLRLEGMMLLRAAQRMVRDDIEMVKMLADADAARIKPILDLMKETRIEQDAAAARAKESSIEIAQRAAVQGADLLAERVVPEVRRLIEKQRSAPAGTTMYERMMGPLADMMGQQLLNMFGGMFGMPPAQGTSAQPQAPPGWEYEEVEGE